MASSDEDIDLDEEISNLKGPKTGGKRKRTFDSDSDDDKTKTADAEPKATKHKAKKAAKKKAGKLKGKKKAAEAEEEVFRHKYDDDLHINEADAQWLLSLTQMEREDEYMRRFEEKEAARDKWATEQKLKKKQLEEAKGEESSDEEEEEEEEDAEEEEEEEAKPARRRSGRGKEDKAEQSSQDDEKDEEEFFSSTRRNTSSSKNKTSKAMKELKKKRALASKKRTDDDDESSEDEGSDYQASDEEDEAPRRGRRQGGLREEEEEEVVQDTTPAEYADILKIFLRRSRIARWAFEPFFEKTIKGCFVRVGIGAHNGEQVYRCVEVRGVQESSRVSSIDGVKINKKLVLAFGPHERPFSMDYISNKEFTELEFMGLRKELKKYNMDLPTKSHVLQKVIDIDNARAYVHTSEEITDMLEKKKSSGNLKSNLARRLDEINAELEIAREEGDDEKRRKLSRMLEQTLEAQETTYKRIEQVQEGIASINARNKSTNTTKYDAPSENTEEVTIFSRRDTRPITFVQRHRDGAEDEPTDDKQQEKPSQPVISPPKQASEPKSFPVVKSIFPAGVDIDIDLGALSAPRGGPLLLSKPNFGPSHSVAQPPSLSSFGGGGVLRRAIPGAIKK